MSRVISRGTANTGLWVLSHLRAAKPLASILSPTSVWSKPQFIGSLLSHQLVVEILREAAFFAQFMQTLTREDPHIAIIVEHLHPKRP